MTRLPRAPNIAYVVLFLVCMALTAVSATTGCTKNQRVESIHASLVAVNAARDGFASWDNDQQQAIVAHATTREEATKALAEYRENRLKVSADFEVAYRLLAVAATQTDDLSLSAALTEASKLVEAIKKLRAVHADPPPSQPPTPAGVK